MRIKLSHYQRERNKGRIFSALLHFILFLFVILGLPSFLTPKPPEEPMAISVEILPLAEHSNVKPAEKPPEPETKPEEKQTEQKKPSPPVKTADSTPPPPPKDAVPLPEKPKEKKPDEKKVEPPKDKKPDEKPEKKKPKEDPLDAILKAVAKTAQKEKKDDKKKEKPTATDSTPNKSKSDRYDPSIQMTMSEKDMIRNQLSKCWNVPAGAKDAQNLSIMIHIEYNRDAMPIKVEVAAESKARYNSDPFFRTAAESAIRAVQMCAPLKGLPADRYNGWSEMDVNFDPKDMLN